MSLSVDSSGTFHSDMTMLRAPAAMIEARKPRTPWPVACSPSPVSQADSVISSARPRSSPTISSAVRNRPEPSPPVSSPCGAGSGRFLTAEEMVGLDLGRAELMTLSACETGLGEQATGQGVLGLRASIMAAGARSIVMSLWKVPDESTLKLMQEFYTNLWVKKLPRIEALKKAQEAVRNEPYERFASPIYWAAWVLVGKGW